MTDGIIKGTGNSRYLKSVANVMSLYPEYTDFLRALAEGTFPVDLYGINAGGWQVRGNDINKASLLKDATASLYGKGTTATVDDILAAIRPLITTAQSTANAAPKIATGTYAGTGDTSKVLSLSFTARFLFVGARGEADGILSVVSAGESVSIDNNNGSKGVKVSVSGTKVTISGNSNNVFAFNYSGFRYMYYAIG